MMAMPSATLIEHYGGPGPRYTSYPAVTEWSAVDSGSTSATLERANRSTNPLSIYVHVPFCVEMCRFCGCNVIATRDQSRGNEYLDVLDREVGLWAARLPDRRTVSQLHLGGGTPTFLSEAQLERLWGILSSRFELLPDAELAIEVDPEITTAGQLRLLGSHGFNRISVGVQDLEPQVQVAIGRIQSAEGTAQIIRNAREAGFRSVNLDLMYGLPHQTPETIRRTIERILEMKPDRLALFGYAHVPWAKPNQRLLPQAYLPSPVERIELFVTAAAMLEKAGFSQVGLDHFARAEDELGQAQRAGTVTRNFQGYSPHAAPDTIAVGPSAISDVDGVFLQNAHLLKEWMRMVRADELPVEKGMARSEDDKRRGYVISTLMCHLRLDFGALQRRFGQPMTQILAEADNRLQELEEDGLIARTPAGLEVLPLGRLFLRNIAMAFDAYLASHPERSQLFSKAV